MPVGLLRYNLCYMHALLRGWVGRKASTPRGLSHMHVGWAVEALSQPAPIAIAAKFRLNLSVTVS